MSEHTHIQWCDHTYNPWRGCRKVAEECENCYIIETPPFRTIGQVHGAQRVRAGAATLEEPLRWNRHPNYCAKCHRWVKGEEMVGFCPRCYQWTELRRRQRVFCLSLGDWLDDEVPSEWLAELLEMIHATPNLDWLLLTKRPQNWATRLNDIAINVDRSLTAWWDWLGCWREGTPPANVWIGVSAGADQAEALVIPARVHFLSCEPMLHPFEVTYAANFDWVIFGGESGRNARPCDIGNIREGMAWCRRREIPVFVKQLGSNPIMEPGPITVSCAHPKGGDIDEWPEDLRVREFPEPQRLVAA